MTPAEAMQSIIHAFHPEEKLLEDLDKLSVKYNGVLNDAGRVLLFLDNAADAAQVQPLLPPDNCLLLVTSRAQFSLPGLAVRNIDCLRAEMSQRLLRDLAPRIEGFENEAAGLCGHLPLALKVFSGVVNDKKLYPVPVLLKRLREGREKLMPVDAAFQVSYDLLADDLRPRWVLLAVFPASFNLAAAAAVWEEREDLGREAMQALVNASLVEFDETNGRFHLHDLVRQFCDGKLTRAERTIAKLKYAGHYRDIGNTADQLYIKGGDNVLQGLELFDCERVNFEAAFEWLKLRNDKPSAALLFNIVGAITYTSHIRFHLIQRICWLEVQLNAAINLKNRRAECSALCNLGNAYADLGNAHKAVHLHGKALVIARELRDRKTEGNALSNLGNAYGELGDIHKSVHCFGRALLIAREVSDSRNEGNALGSLGIACVSLGDSYKAINYFQQWLLIVRKNADLHGESMALMNLGIAYGGLGDNQKAVQFYELTLAMARKMGDRSSEGRALGNLGVAYSLMGAPDKAVEFCERAILIDREVDNKRGEANDLWNSAMAFYKLGERTHAIIRAESSLQIYETIEDPNAAKVRAALAEWRGQA